MKPGLGGDTFHPGQVYPKLPDHLLGGGGGEILPSLAVSGPVITELSWDIKVFYFPNSTGTLVLSLCTNLTSVYVS